MKYNFYCVFAALALTNASPNPQSDAVSNLAKLPAADKVPKTPEPFVNAALWNEAVVNDARLGTSHTENQYFYALLASLQIQENSSLSIIEDSLDGAQVASRALQHLNIPPTEFNQAQALDPAKTQGMTISEGPL